MRKYRGRRVDNGEWVYGYYLKTHSINTHWIIKERLYCSDIILGLDPKMPKHLQGCYKVIPETVGQATGRKDIDKKEIFRNDALKDCGIQYLVCYGESEYGLGWYIKTKTADGGIYRFDKSVSNMKIFGNIHENPELLEVKPSAKEKGK